MAQTVPSEAVSVGSIGLRGGFDSNPTDTPGAHGSLSVTQTVSYDYLRGSLQDGIALKLRATDTIYDPNVVAPSTNVVAAATVATRIAPNLGVSATLTTMIDDNWARRPHSMQLRNRAEYAGLCDRSHRRGLTSGARTGKNSQITSRLTPFRSAFRTRYEPDNVVLGNVVLGRSAANEGR